MLDPSAGTGVFTATSPESAVIDSIELDETSGGIAKVLNDGNRSHTVIAPFEQEAQTIPDDSMDMVMTNVPFGNKNSRGANRLLDNAYQNESLENYFILKSLEKLKPNGLAIFITPIAVVSGKKAGNTKLRQRTALKAEFLGAYRLPNSVFEQTGADVTTDVVVYRKHSKDASDKIHELMDAGEIETLKQANVLWDDYISGNYFKKAGKKFVLGETEQVKNRFGGMSEQVINAKPTGEIAKMLRKFGDSRIDWSKLDASEPTAIAYHNGDTVFQNGKQLTYQDGVWVENEPTVTDTDRAMQDTLATLNDAHSIAMNETTWEDMQAVMDYCQQTGQRDLIPPSVISIDKVLRPASADVARRWNGVSTP